MKSQIIYRYQHLPNSDRTSNHAHRIRETIFVYVHPIEPTTVASTSLRSVLQFKLRLKLCIQHRASIMLFLVARLLAWTVLLVRTQSSKKSANLPSIQLHLLQISKRAVIRNNKWQLTYWQDAVKRVLHFKHLVYVWKSANNKKLFTKLPIREESIELYQDRWKHRLPDRKHWCRMGCKRSTVNPLESGVYTYVVQAYCPELDEDYYFRWLDNLGNN